MAPRDTRPAQPVPLHVAVIMDGNGRWAGLRGKPRLWGHRRGAERLRDVVTACPDLGITHLTCYAFSTENWKRSTEEVVGLMSLLSSFIRREARRLQAEGVRLRFIGDRTRLEPRLQRLMAWIERLTQGNDRLHLTIAVNYGGRNELLRAARRLARAVARGELRAEEITEAHLQAKLDTADLPDPDLVIRTSGEMRVSNFLPWQTTYSEFVFTETLWPDFAPAELAAILDRYAHRERRFGAVTP